MLAEARPLLEQSQRQIAENQQLFANERAMLMAVWGTLHFDACDPNEGLAKVMEIVDPRLSPRFPLPGTCTFSRAPVSCVVCEEIGTRPWTSENGP